MPLKVWKGSAFGDPSDVRVWNGSAFVAPSGVYTWNGTAFVKHWPSFSRQRVNLISEVAAPAGNGLWGEIANWDSDATYPATVSGGRMVVTGSGIVTATVAYRMNTVANTASTIRLTVNGVAVATFPDRLNDGDYVDTASITVANGDVVSLEFKRSVAGSNSLQTPSYIDLSPA